VLIVLLLLLGGGLWLSQAWRPVIATGGESIRESMPDASRAEVVLDYGAGTLHVDALSESNDLISGTVRLHRGERIERSSEVNDGTAYVTLKSRGQAVGPIFGPWGSNEGWTLGLSRDLPIRLRVDVGLGQASIDARRLKLTYLDVDPGIGQTIVILPERGQLEVRVDGGIGEVIVRVPEGMSLRAEIDSGLGTSSAPSGYRHEGKVYTSPDYGEAENRVDLVASVGIGQVVIQNYRGE